MLLSLQAADIGRIVNIIVLTLAVYSIIIKLISKLKTGTVIREIWIFLCGVLSFFDVFLLISLPPGNTFIVLNKIQLALLVVILIFIILDFFKMTSIRPGKWLLLMFPVPVACAILLFLTPALYFNSSNRLVTTEAYAVFFASTAVLGLVPPGIFLARLLGKNRQTINLREILPILIAYLGIYVSAVIDGTDISRFLENSTPPVTTFAFLFLGVMGLVATSLNYKKVVDKVSFYAAYDELTETLKRTKGLEYIENLTAQRRNSREPFTVIFFDVKNFQRFNDLYGNTFGNMALVEISRVLKQALGKNGIICRTGGDEFMLVADGAHYSIDDSPLLKEIIDYFSQSFLVRATPIRIFCNMGLSVFPDHGTGASELLQNANYSLTQVKNRTGQHYLVFDSSMESEKQNTNRIEVMLRETLQGKDAEKRFELFYQPKVNNRNRIIGCEALLRWKYDGDFFTPDQFIPIAEKTGLIVDIGYLVLQEGCRRLAEWSGRGTEVNVSLNLSIHQLKDPDLLKIILDNIESFDIDPARLEFEITESSIMDFTRDFETLSILSNLNTLGVKISIDDFGTGYSSFSRIIDLPINIIKIDRSFIRNLPHNEKSIKVCLSIISLAHELGIATVAEGVETPEQAEFLFSNDCDYIQGFYFYKPMPHGELDKLI